MRSRPRRPLSSSVRRQQKRLGCAAFAALPREQRRASRRAKPCQVLPIFAGVLLRLSAQMRGAPACGSQAWALGSHRSGPEAAAPQSRRRCWRCTGPGASKSSPGAWKALLLPWRRCLTIRSSGPLRIGDFAIMPYRGSGRLAQALACIRTCFAKFVWYPCFWRLRGSGMLAPRRIRTRFI